MADYDLLAGSSPAHRKGHLAKPLQTDTQPLTSVGLLCNPLSGYNRKRLDAVRRAAATFSGSLYREASTVPEINATLDHFAAEKIDLLVVIGGDGTVQASLKHIFGSASFSKPPLLTIIPAGTTNMTAADLGIRGKPDRVLTLLNQRLQQAAPTASTQRSVLRIEQQGMDTEYGMFFAAGIIASGVKFFTPQVQAMRINGELASGLVLIRYLARLLSGKTHESLSPVQLMIREDDGMAREERCLFIFASTMDHLLLGMRPYWGDEASPIHVTLVQPSPRRLWRSLPALLSGRGSKLKRADGYHSRNLQVLELHMDGDFIVDGELYQANSQRSSVKITTVGPVGFFNP